MKLYNLRVKIKNEEGFINIHNRSKPQVMAFIHDYADILDCMFIVSHTHPPKIWKYSSKDGTFSLIK